MKNRKMIFYMNAPVILGMTFLSLSILIVDSILKGALNRILGMYYTSWTDPLMYLRFFTHVLTHADLTHFTGNFMLILVVGPLVEDKYGSGNLMKMICITALTTGLVDIIFFRNTMFLGASGIVFMLILLASFTDLKDGKLPITVLLVAILYIGNEIISGILLHDNVSQLSHIVGGLSGAVCGFSFHKNKTKNHA